MDRRDVPQSPAWQTNVSVVVIIAVVSVNSHGRLDPGYGVSTSEAEPIWTEFLHTLTHRRLRGVKLVVFDAYEGLEAQSPKFCAPPGKGAVSTS